jgi:hypothetical protein
MLLLARMSAVDMPILYRERGVRLRLTMVCAGKSCTVIDDSDFRPRDGGEIDTDESGNDKRAG